MDHDTQSVRVRRFKHQSYNETLKTVHLPSALSQSEFSGDISDNESHFHECLEHWKQLNLSPGFLRYAQQAGPLSASMPLLLHNQREILDSWMIALKMADDEDLIPLLDLLQKLVHDLRTALASFFPTLLEHLFPILQRSIPAQSLTVLVTTLAALFKHLLVPSIQPQLLEQTWRSLRQTLVKCLPEVQRAVAEVWGSLIRRLKGSHRDSAVNLVAAETQGIEDTSAWVFVFASKSVSQTLHTATLDVISPLLVYHMSCSQPDKTGTLIRRVLTALLHHVNTADQFLKLGNLIIENFCDCLPSEGSLIDKEKLCRAIDILFVLCAVRQGSRLSEKQLHSIASTLHQVPFTNRIQISLLKLWLAVLTAGDMALWLGPGREILQSSWQTASFGIILHSALVEAGWGGFDAIALPIVLRKTPQLLQQEPRRTMQLLALLQREKRLTDVDIVWREYLDTWTKEQLTSWTRSEESVLQLSDILTLSGHISSITPLLINILKLELNTSGPREDYQASFANSALVLGLCMQGIAKRNKKEWISKIDIIQCTRQCMRNWHWSEHVIAGLVALWRASDAKDFSIAIDEFYPLLHESILSCSHSLRLNALRLLALLSDHSGSENSSHDVIKGCLQGEEVSLDIQGVRERVLRIRRLYQFVKDGDHIGVDVCARWLIAQLKVNLRPLWSPAASALATLAQRFDDLVWRILYDEIKASTEEIQLEAEPAWANTDSESDDPADDPWEEERSWRDPNAHKLRTLVVKWAKGNSTRTGVLRMQRSQDRLDVHSYGLHLLSSLRECTSLAEKHNRDLIPYFISLIDPENPHTMAKQNLSAWLSLFSTFSNPKALYLSEKLHLLYINLLSHPDRSIQTLALSCLLTYKSPHLMAHEDKLRSILDGTRWRDELTSLDLANVEAADRHDVINVTIRLLFGLMLEKTGRSRGADRRAAVLSALGGCTDDELRLLVDLMLRPIDLSGFGTKSEHASLRQQLGFLVLLGDVLKTLGTRITSAWPTILASVIQLTGRAHQQLSGDLQQDGTENDEEDGDDEQEIDASGAFSDKKLRLIRQLGVKRLADFFRSPVEMDLSAFVKEAFELFISPRLSVLDRENTQAPSALLDLFNVWAVSRTTVVYLTRYDSRVLPKVYDCLVAKNVKPAIIMRVFDIVDRILSISFTDQEVSALVLRPHVSLLLNKLAILFEHTNDKASITTSSSQRQINILAQVAPYCSDSVQASTLVKLVLPYLKRPAKLVPERMKTDLLKTLQSLLPLIPGLSDAGSSLTSSLFECLSQMFQILRSRQARQALITTFGALASIDSTLKEVFDYLESLNAFSSKRIEEPDFDRRLEAFVRLNGTFHQSLTYRLWLPLLHNMLYFLHDPDELAIRNNAAFSLRQFIDRVEEDVEFEKGFTRVLYPSLKNGLRSKHELVRAEILGVIAHAVNKCTRHKTVQEMRVLLAGGDEEASFFTNIHHVQVHRRTRALRRLAEQCDEGHFSSSTLAEIFVPLVCSHISATASLEHLLVNEAIQTIGRLAKHLSWTAYLAMVQKYIGLLKLKDESERLYMRTLVAILENFHFHLEVVEEISETPAMSVDEVEPPVSPTKQVGRVGATICDAVRQRLLPTLLDHLQTRDSATEDGSRIPMAIGIANLAKHLPGTSGELHITRLFTLLSQILRSKSQETRDLARDALCKVAINLGPASLPLMFREMRGALVRGPQLHVLAHVTHSIIVHVTSGDHASSFDILDDCVENVVHASAEVVFGQSGKDVQTEGFKTKLREVKTSSSKGLDSFMIMARHVTPQKISNLLEPIRSIMQETGSLKIMGLVDEVLKRVVSGLNSNNHLTPSELLVLCHTLITQNSRFLARVSSKILEKQKNDAIVQLKQNKPPEVDHFANNSYRFVAFGLDLLNTALKRNRFDFQDRDIIARLNSMVSVVGNSLYSTNTTVLLLGLRTVARLVKTPLTVLEDSVPVFIRQILDIIRRTGNTESELIQIAFKSLATILRDGPNVHIQEKDLIYLLELLSPDLEEPSRQASVFIMLRAIVSKRFMAPEIYDLMTRVAEVMVTSQSSQVRELCRGVLLQFVLDYPQGKGRLNSQITFLAKNLSYIHETGRASVMEFLSAVLSKFQDNLILEYADLLFVAFVMVIANDDSSKCKEMAAQLIKTLISRLDSSQRQVLISHLHAWSSQKANMQLTRVAFQVYGLVVDVMGLEVAPHLSIILGDLNTALQDSAKRLGAIQGDLMDLDLDWQVPYHAMLALSKILLIYPDFTTDAEQVSWGSVMTHLLFPHGWVRSASCRLLGLLFNAVPPSPPLPAPKHDSTVIPTLTLDGIRECAEYLCLQLKSENLDDPFSLQIVKNLFYIGKCFYAISESTFNGSDEQQEEDNESHEELTMLHKSVNPLSWMFSKLSYQFKSAHIARRNTSIGKANWSLQPLSVLKWFAAMASYIDPVRLEKYLVHILAPIYRITDDDTIRDTQIDELKTVALELQDLVQRKVGVSKFSAVYQQIRQGTINIRRERKATRVLQVATDPEAAAKRRLHRNLAKKESRKRKSRQFADRKGGTKRRREE